jgi:hypothetical protein
MQNQIDQLKRQESLEHQTNHRLFSKKLSDYFDRIKIYKYGSYINQKGEIIPHNRGDWVNLGQDHKVHKLGKTYDDYKIIMACEIRIGDTIIINGIRRYIVDVQRFKKDKKCLVSPKEGGKISLGYYSIYEKLNTCLN